MPSDLYGAGTVQIDARIAAFTAVLMLATTMLFGVLPAFRGTRLPAGTVLRRAWARDDRSGSRRTQRTLVACEVALAVVLLIGAGVLLRSFARLNAVLLGFDRTRTLTAELFCPRRSTATGRRPARSIELRWRGQPGSRASLRPAVYYSARSRARTVSTTHYPSRA